MGAFFGSIHLRTTDHDAVRRAVETVAAQHRIKCLLAPAIGDWITLYPSSHGQDEQPTHTLAALLPDVDLFHLVLHDDDVFAYGFFRHGKLLDEYNSCPDYFGQVPAADHDRQRGRPERFADILGSSLPKLERLLHDGSGDAMTLFEQFASLLHLPNAATSYEYLIDGETDGIARFKEFIPIPDPRAERTAKKAQQAAIKARKKSLQSAGALLAEFSGGKGNGFPPHPLFNPVGGSDFLFCWRTLDSKDSCDLVRIGPASGWKPCPTPVQLGPNVHSLAASPSGRYLVAMYASGDWISELWDLANCSRIATLGHCTHATASAVFSSDESLVLIRSEGQLQCVRTADGSLTGCIDIAQQGRCVTIHPSEPYAVVDALGQPLIVDLQQRRPFRRLLIGRVPDQLPDMVRQAQMRLDAASSSAERELWERLLDSARHAPENTKHDQRRGSEVIRDLAFSADGRYLLTATGKGARAYDWPSVLAATEDMPAPTFAAEAESVTYELGPGNDHANTNTTAVAHDCHHNRMLFAGIEGKVRSIDLATGREETILEVPGRPPISQMHLSADASVLALAFKTVHFERAPKTPWWLQFWRYPLPPSAI